MASLTQLWVELPIEQPVNLAKYRPYLLWMAIPYALLGVLAFNTPDTDTATKLVYAYITYTLLMTVYTAINIPYSALGGVMTGDSSERTSIQSYRFSLAMLGGALTVYLLPKLVNYFGNGDEASGYPIAMGVMGPQQSFDYSNKFCYDKRASRFRKFSKSIHGAIKYFS